MLVSQIPTNSFYSYDDLQIYKNKNGVLFLALADQEIKRTDKMPVDVPVKESSKNDFITELKKASINTGMSHLLRDGLLKELQ